MVNHGPITFNHLNKMLTNIQSIKLKPALKPKFRVLYQPFWSSYGILCQKLRFLLIIINIINYFKRVQDLFFCPEITKREWGVWDCLYSSSVSDKHKKTESHSQFSRTKSRTDTEKKLTNLWPKINQQQMIFLLVWTASPEILVNKSPSCCICL